MDFHTLVEQVPYGGYSLCDVSGEPVKFGYNQRIAMLQLIHDQFFKLWPCGSFAGELFLNDEFATIACQFCTLFFQRIAL